MKFNTDWWGAQFLAETEEDKVILQNLHTASGEKAGVGYDSGDLVIF